MAHHCDHAPILHRYEDMASQKSHAWTDAQVILYSVQCYCIALDRQQKAVIKTVKETAPVQHHTHLFGCERS